MTQKSAQDSLLDSLNSLIENGFLEKKTVEGIDYISITKTGIYYFGMLEYALGSEKAAEQIKAIAEKASGLGLFT